MRRLVNIVVGLVGLLLLVVGAPMILWAVGKDLIPDHLPSLGEVWDALLGPDTGRLFIGALVLIGAVAWVVLIAALVLEIPAVLAGRTRPRIRGMGWAQSTASVLLFMIVTGAVGSNMAAAQTLPPLSVPISTAATVDRAMAAAAATHSETTTPVGVTVLTGRPLPTHTVQPGETTWSIAERTLGSGDRTGEIIALNVGKPQPDGGTLTANSFPRPGWVLQLPADARTAAVAPSAPPDTSGDREVLVVPGDTLSGIAQRELGDAAEFPALAAVNHLSDPNDILAGSTIIIPEQLPSPDTATAGEREVLVVPGDTLSGIAQRELGDAAESPALAAVNHLSDPNDILAGSTITIPAPAVEAPAPPAGDSIDDPTPDPDPSTAAAPVQAAAPTVEDPTAPAPAATAPPQAAEAPGFADQPTPGPVVTPAPTTTSTTTPQTHTQPQPSDAAPASPAEDESNVGALIGIGALTAAALWAGLLAARRRSNRGRRPGRQAPTLNPAAVRTEKRLRERAAEVNVAWLDLALRSLGTVLATNPGQAPDITAAFLGPRGLRLQLAAPQPAPAPFVTDGDNWWLPAAAELPITAFGAVDQMAPLPTLTSIGTLDNETVLVDLERLGSVGLQGDPDGCRHLMAHMVTELAHQTWSDGVNVTLVSWGQHLVPLNPDRLSYSPSPRDVTRVLKARIREVAAALDGLDTDVATARSQDIAGDSWTPHVLLIDATEVEPADLDELQEQLSALCNAGRVATAVVMRGGPDPVPPVAFAHVTSDGLLSLPVILSANRCAAAALTDADLSGLRALFDNAEQDAVAIPPSALDEPWAAHMDDSGALLPAVAMVEPVEIWETAPPPPTAAGEQSEPGGWSPARSVTPADLTKLEAVLADDPTLDDDLSEWHSDAVRKPRVAILGPAQITAPGETPKRLKWFTEVGVYLALHSKGVNLEKFAADLWPQPGKPGQSRAIATSTRNETASKIRKWMGTHPETGVPFVPMGTDKYYRLDGRLLDLELFRRLRERGDAKVAAGVSTAIDDYVTALNLVRGPILPEASGTGWGWLANEDRREDLRAPGYVVDAAHRTVQVALTAGDLDRARWAANLAHDTDPYSDVPLLDLLVIAAQAGDMATANKHAWEVVWANEKDVPEELPTETFQVINRIFPTGLRAVSN